MSRAPQDGARITACAPGGVGLLIIDMINDLAFEGADAMLEEIERASEVVHDLRSAADDARVPVIYVNDNYGQWHSERSRIVEHCRRGRGRNIVSRLEPRPDDYFVIKPQLSGFYATNLPVLLPKLGVSRLVLTGIATDICVLFTAADAHMRSYDLWVPGDATASSRPEHLEWALQIMQKSLGAEIRPTSGFPLQRWLSGP